MLLFLRGMGQIVERTSYVFNSSAHASTDNTLSELFFGPKLEHLKRFYLALH